MLQHQEEFEKQFSELAEETNSGIHTLSEDVKILDGEYNFTKFNINIKNNKNCRNIRMFNYV